MGGILVSLRLSVRLSIHASCVCSVAPTVLVVWHIKFLAKFQNSNFWQIFRICYFVFFWLGIWCESLVWVIKGRRRVSKNAGILVALVLVNFTVSFWTSKESCIKNATDLISEFNINQNNNCHVSMLILSLNRLSYSKSIVHIGRLKTKQHCLVINVLIITISPAVLSLDYVETR